MGRSLVAAFLIYSCIFVIFVSASNTGIQICRSAATNCQSLDLQTTSEIDNARTKIDFSADHSQGGVVATLNSEEEEEVLNVYHVDDDQALTLRRGGGGGSRSSGGSSSRGGSSGSSRSSSSSSASRSSSRSYSSASASRSSRASNPSAASSKSSSSVKSSSNKQMQTKSNPLTGLFSKLTKQATNLAKKHSYKQLSRVNNLISKVAKKLATGAKSVSKNIATKAKKLASQAKRLTRRTSSTAKRIASKLGNKFSKGAKKLQTKIKSKITKVKSQLKRLYKINKNKVSKLGDKLKQKLNKLKLQLKKQTRLAALKTREITKKSKDLAAKIKNFATKAQTKMKEIVVIRVPKMINKSALQAYMQFYINYAKLRQERAYFFDFSRAIPNLATTWTAVDLTQFDLKKFITITELLPNTKDKKQLENLSLSSKNTRETVEMHVSSGSVQLNSQCMTSCEWFGYQTTDSFNKKPYCEKCNRQFLFYEIPSSKGCFNFPSDIHSGKIPLNVLNAVKQQCAKLGACTCEDSAIQESKSVLVLSKYLTGAVTAIIDMLQIYEIEKSALVTASVRQAQAELQVKAKARLIAAKTRVEEKKLRDDITSCLNQLTSLENESLKSIGVSKYNIVEEIKNRQRVLEQKIKTAANNQAALNKVEAEIKKFAVTFKEQASKFKNNLQKSNKQCLKNFGIFMDLSFA